MKRLPSMAAVLIPLSAIAGSSGVMPDGPDAYRVMHTGRTGFVSSGSLQRKAYEEASGFCAQKSLIMETISIESQRARPFGGFPEATLRFKCVARDDNPVDQKTDAEEVGAPDKYAKIEQLKRLLDSGALTQEEFDKEKAKILGN
jgi:hypothetical protein